MTNKIEKCVTCHGSGMVPERLRMEVGPEPCFDCYGTGRTPDYDLMERQSDMQEPDVDEMVERQYRAASSLSLMHW